MSRLLNALNMYFILQGRNQITGRELADILDVTPRMIKSYRKDLVEAGIKVGSTKGRYGGYHLEKGVDLKGIGIREEELEALKMAREVIRSGNHLFAKDFEVLANKILDAQNDFDDVNYFGKDVLRPENMKKRELEIWNIICKGIKQNRKIKICYQSLDKDLEKRKTENRIVHPHGTFEHQGAEYCFGYCELRKQRRYFKLARIQDIKILEDKFTINVKYDIKEELGKSFGIFNDEIFDLKLKISYPMSQIVRERQYAVNQKISDLDDETIIFEATLKGYEEVRTWVLGMGSKVEVLEPERLREDVQEEIGKLEGIYCEE